MPQPIPTLTEHLLSEYRQRVPADQASLDGFVAFCEQYLDSNPAVQVWYPGKSIGLMLANHTQIVLSRNAQAQALNKSGGMEPADAVPITAGEGFGDTPR